MDGAQPFALVRDGAVGVSRGKVAWIGRRRCAGRRCRQDVEHRRRGSDAGLGRSAAHIVYGEEGLVDFELLSEGGMRSDLEAASPRSNGQSLGYCLMPQSGAAL
jgi:hypothetical protein